MAGNMEYKNSVKIRLRTWNIGTLIWRGLEICEELLMRSVGQCGLLAIIGLPFGYGESYDLHLLEILPDIRR